MGVKNVLLKKHLIYICPEHGEFWQTPNAHLKLYEGCPLCKNSRMCDYLINAFKENNIDFELEKKLHHI